MSPKIKVVYRNSIVYIVGMITKIVTSMDIQERGIDNEYTKYDLAPAPYRSGEVLCSSTFLSTDCVNRIGCV
jgi:hypothetical protein